MRHQVTVYPFHQVESVTVGGGVAQLSVTN